MSLISQPGSDYQATQVTLDAGNARDIMLLLLDVHAVLDHLHLDGTQPRITAPAEDYLRESASPYTLPALISALDDVITMLTRAIRDTGPPAPIPTEPWTLRAELILLCPGSSPAPHNCRSAGLVKAGRRPPAGLGLDQAEHRPTIGSGEAGHPQDRG